MINCQNIDFQQPSKVNVQWYHQFAYMIDDGSAASMGPYAWLVLSVIKRYANFETGNAFPGIETICQKSSLSPSQVKREIKKLTAMKFLVKERKGRNNHYRIKEHIPVPTIDGQRTATFEYAPSRVALTISELKRLLVEGRTDGTFVQLNNVENLAIHVHIGDNYSIKTGPEIKVGEILENIKDEKTRKILVSRLGNVDK